MARDKDEAELLRSVALQNAQSILQARKRLDEELFQAKEALETRTAELARSLAMMRATLEATGDGILVTDRERRIIDYNGQYVAMWRLPDGLLESAECHHPLDACSSQLRDPARYNARLDEIYQTTPQKSSDLLEFLDGRMFERVSQIQYLDGKEVGRVWSFRDISERKRSEEILRQQSEWLRVTLGSIGDGVIATDADGCVTFLNGVAEQLTGWPMAEAAGRRLIDVFKIVDERTRESVDNPALRALREGVVQDLVNHTLLISRDGIERPIDDSAAPMRDASGTIIGSVLIFRDITARQQSDKAQVMLAAIVESSDDAIISKDLDGIIRSWNRGAERLFGYTGDEVIGQPITLLIPPELIGEEQQILQKLRRGERIEHFETIRMSKRGHRLNISLTISPVRDYQGRIIGVSKIARDVTESRRLQDILAWDALLLASVRDAMVVVDLNGLITYWNEGATRLLGWSANEAMGTHYSERFTAAAHALIDEQIGAQPTGAREWSGESEALRKDGSGVWVDARIVPVSDAAGRPLGILGLAHDITERRRAEEALREADRHKDEFLALLAHELRNPLAPLRNGLQVMKLAAGDAKAVAQARAMMERQLGHMVRLVDDLLDLARIGQNKIELRRAQITLREIIDNAVETARPAIEVAGHELTVALPAGESMLDADLTRLAQVFSNLLTNSAKYTEHGGHIWLTGEQRGSEVVVSVRDTGIGIPTDALPKVFNLFSQVDRSNERASGGLGIGLSLVKGFVEMHGGSVVAESAGRGKGSQFTIRLPLVSATHAPAGETRNQTPTRAAGRRILIVDDNEDAARSLARVLSLQGDDVLAVHDGIEAISLVETFQPHVILMDVGMPRMNGYEVSRRIRKNPWGSTAVIIAVTGWGQDGDRIESREAGCDGHLVKPVDLAELDKLMDSLANAKQAASPEPGMH